ncbi:MAG: YlxR family protein [Chloroflexi bacterium]|nr:YlxR family protein [Chloroflexota bacterium]
MNKQKGKRVRHIPQRTCVGCRQVNDKRELIRVVRTPEGVRIDRTGKLAGRGAYVHALRSCWIKGLKGALANALKTQLSSQDQALLESFLAELPEESELDETS